MPRFTSITEVIAAYGSLFRPDQAEGIDGVVQLNLTGDDGGTYHLIIKDQALTTVEGAIEDPTVTVTVSADNWLRVMNGQANPMGLMMTGKLKVGGNLALATKFQSLFG